MSGSYSIAEAKNHLPRLVHEAEQGQAVQLTRRGQPVAVLVSLATWDRIAARPSFWKALGAFRSSLDVASLGIDPAPLNDARDHTQGREVRL